MYVFHFRKSHSFCALFRHFFQACLNFSHKAISQNTVLGWSNWETDWCRHLPQNQNDGHGNDGPGTYTEVDDEPSDDIVLKNDFTQYRYNVMYIICILFYDQ